MNPLVLDVRTKKEFCSGHLHGSVLVETPLPPLTPNVIKNFKIKLQNKLKYYPKNQKIHVYCKKGIRAGEAAKILKAMGYKNVKVLGGVEANPLKNQISKGKYKMCVCKR